MNNDTTNQPDNFYYNVGIYEKDFDPVRLKYRQLGREIEKLPPGIARENLEHSHSKLGCFLEDILGHKLWRGQRVKYTKLFFEYGTRESTWKEVQYTINGHYEVQEAAIIAKAMCLAGVSDPLEVQVRNIRHVFVEE